MKVYIATNKDNKDSLMHYGVKGMRWGKRGGRRAGDLEKDSTRTSYADTQSVSRRKNNKNNIFNSSRPRYGSPYDNKQNQLSTSQKTSSAPDKRIKQYFREKIDRQRAEERKQEQQRRVDARRRQQYLKKEQIEEKYWHGTINNAMHQRPYLENEYKQWKQENSGKKHTRGMGWKKDHEYNNRKTYRR